MLQCNCCKAMSHVLVQLCWSMIIDHWSLITCIPLHKASLAFSKKCWIFVQLVLWSEISRRMQRNWYEPVSVQIFIFKYFKYLYLNIWSEISRRMQRSWYEPVSVQIQTQDSHFLRWSKDDLEICSKDITLLIKMTTMMLQYSNVICFR